jgi:hypothetical protein
MHRQKPSSPREPTPHDSDARREPELEDELDTEHRKSPNPPRTTTRRMTSPKFGSAGSGGAELEPGPERP